jgi:hypothetical protein
MIYYYLYKSTYLDLCHTPIDEQFNSGDTTAIIRREERDGFGDFVRSAHPPQRYGGYKARLELLKLFLTLCQAIKARCVNHTFTTKSFKV